MLKTVYRGEVYLCRFGKGNGSEQGGTRPVVIIQNDIGNKNSTTTIGMVITSKQKKEYPMHVTLEAGQAGLTEDSTILGEQIFTLDKNRLIRYMGTLNHDEEVMEKLGEAIKISLGL